MGEVAGRETGLGPGQGRPAPLAGSGCGQDLNEDKAAQTGQRCAEEEANQTAMPPSGTSFQNAITSSAKV